MRYISLLKPRNTLVPVRSKGPVLCLVIPITHQYTSTDSTELQQRTNEVSKRKRVEKGNGRARSKPQMKRGLCCPDSAVLSRDDRHQLPLRSCKIKGRNLNMFWKPWHCQAKCVHMPGSFLSSSRGCSLLRLFPAKYICLIYVINFCVNEG